MWNRWFFDALENKDAGSAGLALLAFGGIALLLTALAVAIVLGRETLQVRWREWLTRTVVEAWLGRQRFYHLNAADKDATIPEYRIADDIRWATEPIIDFFIGLLTAIIAIVSFVSILWIVGGSIKVGTDPDAFEIPAYMVLAVIVHGGCITTLTLFMGRSLPQRMAARNEAEANFRFSLMRMRENAESIAMTRGEANERAHAMVGLGDLVSRWLSVVRMDGRLTWVLSGNGVINPVIPLLLAAPKYLSGDISLGAVVQLATAYVPVQAAIAWIADNFRAISNWHASARRLGEMIQAMRDLDDDLSAARDGGVRTSPGGADALVAVSLNVDDRKGARLVGPVDFNLRSGDRILITGSSGVGKSTLARALVGLWPWGSGEVRLPPGAEIGFVAGKAYFPRGALRTALHYPKQADQGPDSSLEDALRRCGLAHLIERLDSEQIWDQFLSNGERQRLAFARLLIQRPDIIILDEALASLDEADQRTMMGLLRSDLPKAIVICVSNLEAPLRLYDRIMVLTGAPGGAILEEIPGPASERRPIPESV